MTHYEERGKGTPLVLVHGAQGTIEGFGGMVKILGSRYRVVTPSLPGRSGSEPMSGKVTIERYADHIASLLPMINVEKAVMAGSSMGGLVSLSFCLDHSAMVLGLVLIDTPSRVKIDERIIKLFEDDYENTTRLAASLGYSKRTPKERIETALKYNLECPKETAITDLKATGQFDPGRRLKEIRVPTLILRGSEDILTPKSMSDTLTREIRGSIVRIIRGAGHSSVVEKPRELSETIIKFLQNHGI